jgi:multisubunit Na+/H+ antiporter MnhC subunit
MEILIIGTLALFLVGVYGFITKKHLLRLLIALVITIESSHMMLMVVGYLTNSTIPQEMLIASMVISGCTIGIFASLTYRMIQENLSIHSKDWGGQNE